MLAVVAVPLLLALIGWGVSDEDEPAAGTATGSVAPSSAAPAAPSPAAGTKYGAMSIVRSGNGFTLTGELPDASFRDSLATSLKQAMPGANIVDDLVVAPGVKGPEFAGLGGMFGAALDIPGFSAKFDGDTVTLAGTAPTLVQKAAAESSATATWPDAVVVNDIRVGAAPATAPATASAAPAPAPAAAGACETLQAEITAMLRTPITFDTNGFTLQPGSARLLGQIADEIKACPGTKIAVVGYADDRGADAINVPLSASRAKSVADALVSDGVAGVTSRGAGSAKPIAGNDTPAGRAQNRRVDIIVG